MGESERDGDIVEGRRERERERERVNNFQIGFHLPKWCISDYLSIDVLQRMLKQTSPFIEI
jgi:hypothetical protein